MEVRDLGMQSRVIAEPMQTFTLKVIERARSDKQNTNLSAIFTVVDMERSTNFLFV